MSVISIFVGEIERSKCCRVSDSRRTRREKDGKKRIDAAVECSTTLVERSDALRRLL
jgi:hypothetical protein